MKSKKQKLRQHRKALFLTVIILSAIFLIFATPLFTGNSISEAGAADKFIKNFFILIFGGVISFFVVLIIVFTIVIKQS